MNIGDILDFVWFLENKEQTAWHTPVEITSALHRSQMDLYDRFAPVYGKDETAKKALNPFYTVFQFTPATSPFGLVTLPTGTFGHLLSADAISYDNVRGTQWYPIDIINNDEFSLRMRSQLIPVSYQKPIAKDIGNGVIQLYPQQANTGTVSYLSIPISPLYNYTQSGRVITYVPLNSVQLQWNESFFSAIIKRALFYLGVNIEDQLLIQLMGDQQNPAN